MVYAADKPIVVYIGLVGDESVGKTQLKSVYCKQSTGFQETYIPTIGADEHKISV